MAATFATFATMVRASTLEVTMRLGRALLAVALILAVTAPGADAAGLSATERQYINEQGPVQRSGFWGSAPTISDAQVLSIGYTACSLFARGLPELQVLGEMASYVPPVGSQARSVGLDGVRDARRYLCP